MGPASKNVLTLNKVFYANTEKSLKCLTFEPKYLGRLTSKYFFGCQLQEIDP